MLMEDYTRNSESWDKIGRNGFTVCLLNLKIEALNNERYYHWEGC
jgi:hypothetical protein